MVLCKGSHTNNHVLTGHLYLHKCLLWFKPLKTEKLTFEGIINSDYQETINKVTFDKATMNKVKINKSLRLTKICVTGDPYI